jgi:hypothetical protein
MCGHKLSTSWQPPHSGQTTWGGLQGESPDFAPPSNPTLSDKTASPGSFNTIIPYLS